MERPTATRIFLDGGDPSETRRVRDALGFLDGQTTNPTLISKHPEAHERLARGERFAQAEILAFYRAIVREISAILPEGSISIEVYADRETTAAEMIAEAREMFRWVPNAHVKFPSTTAGLEAARLALAEGLRVNMTLCFSQEQAAAVYAATRGAPRGSVYVSPFIGRLDDRGEKGIDLVANILRMYRAGDGHVLVLTASIRNLDQVHGALDLGSDILTAPAAILEQWAALRRGNGAAHAPSASALAPIRYQSIDLDRDWRSYDLSHELTDRGMEKFSADWRSLLAAPLRAASAGP